MAVVASERDSFRMFLAKQAFKFGSIAGAWKIALPPLEKAAHILALEKGDPQKGGSRRQREDKFYMLFNVVRAAFKAYDKGSDAYREKILSLFLREFLGPSQEAKKQEFKERYGVKPPGFITISPEGSCNLRCKNCYASSLTEKMPSLSAETLSRILHEKYNLWGSWFNVISGGEPFMWNDNGTDLIDIASLNPDQFFMVYTNGTLIDEKKARRMAEIGNITPAVSVEGFEKETDARRGNGTFKKILRSFEVMRDAGVPFGISVTATDENADVVFTDDAVDFYFGKQGAIYEWVFQYMPIGRGADVAGQISPQTRRKIWFHEQELVRKHRLLIADFWNGGTFSSGCIAGGREDGYLYIDWNGNIYPCVFIPYYKDNIHQVFAEGKTVSDILFSDLFKGIRDWQLAYGYQKHPAERGNQILPCFMRDHHCDAHNLFIEAKANPGNESAKICLNDESYLKNMKQYDALLADALDPIWEEKYREP